MHKKFLLLIIFFAVLCPLALSLVLSLSSPRALASIGTVIAPASGTYNLTLDGMTIDFVVYNTGSEEANYTISIGGTAENFTTVEREEARIRAGGYTTFRAIIKPTKDVEVGETYTLIAMAKVVSPGIITVGAKSNLKLLYLGKRVVRPKVPLPVTEIIELIAAGEIGIFSYDVETGITDIIIKAKNDISNIEITVTSQIEQPDVVLAAATGYSYLYQTVDKVNIDNADITKATIKFQVEKNWLEGNNISSATVVLYRYSNDRWDKLPTTRLTEDANYVYYQAESPDLPVFAISGKPSAPPIPPFEEIKEKIFEEPVLYVAIAVVALIILVIYYKKGKAKKSKAPRTGYKRKRL